MNKNEMKKKRGFDMSQKGSAVMAGTELLERSTVERISEEAEKITKKAVRECCTDGMVHVDYLGIPVEALEIDVRKFIAMMSAYIVLS